jgi:hypothetical protein
MRDAGKSQLSVDSRRTAAAAAAAAGVQPSPTAAGLQLLRQQLQQQGNGSLLAAAASGSSGNLVADYGVPGAFQSAHSDLLPASSAAPVSFIGGLGGGLNRMFNSSGNLLALAGATGGLGGLAGSGLGVQPQDWLRSGVLECKDPVEYLRVQYGHVWNEIQEEALLLLAELLRASLRSGSAAAAPLAGGARCVLLCLLLYYYCCRLARRLAGGLC